MGLTSLAYLFHTTVRVKHGSLKISAELMLAQVQPKYSFVDG